MNSTFEYKGYIGSAEVDVSSGVLHGKLLYIRDTITYEAAAVAELRTAFERAVDDYLAACAQFGDEPEKPLKGSFNVRVGPERHKRIAVAARGKGMGLNDYVCWAIDLSLQSRAPASLPWVTWPKSLSNRPPMQLLVYGHGDELHLAEGSTAASTELTLSTASGNLQ